MTTDSCGYSEDDSYTLGETSLCSTFSNPAQDARKKPVGGKKKEGEKEEKDLLPLLLGGGSAPPAAPPGEKKEEEAKVRATPVIAICICGRTLLFVSACSRDWMRDTRRGCC